MVESVDAVGRKAYVKTDLLGRTVETAVWNVSSLAYGNRTAVTYNALSEVVASQDAKLQTTIVYYNSLGKPKMTVFPDSTDANMRYSLLYYDDNLRAFQTVDVIGRVSVSAYDAIGRVTSFTLKPSLSTVCPTNCYVATYGYDSVHDDLKTIDNGTAKITRGYDSLHRLVAEKLEVPAGTVIDPRQSRIPARDGDWYGAGGKSAAWANAAKHVRIAISRVLTTCLSIWGESVDFQPG